MYSTIVRLYSVIENVWYGLCLMDRIRVVKKLWTVSLTNDLLKINKTYLKILDRFDGGCNQGISSVIEKLLEINRISSFFCFFLL